ncbi:VacB/RNase II family 3'-5' exoribonuclease [Aestuariicella sp. G3-2]|uniref:VacB/RNase II family 3'-5' exoribonuclease n=1 Tax=Pseudomaricurvus albidus TaxID=2842452 RepID=UPI001C0D0847|nr:VacB/RNase II family 3'-5' exoribonuclease [Aestuariicella albida]MBU3071468.1 VacB/RNase II family 3'-5' exoribonuclease [Aestuariicella albida]
MLDLNALSQLNQLKESIRSDKNLAEGTVRGSQGRFGFVTLDDGREAFLAPDEMARVLPGDRVEVSVTEKKDNPDSNKIEVELDKLLSSTTKTLIGQYLVRGKGHFIAIDMPQLNRWIFLPPKARGKAKEGDFLVCRLTRHPFEDGKGQAKVVEILGKPGDAGIEHKVVCHKHNLPTQWNKEEQAQLDTICQQPLTALSDYDSRAKVQETLFVTIDSATTKDMDDALSVEANDQGWLLKVAIADPTSSIPKGSALDKAAHKRANTAYLPGQAITMLPEELSHNAYSLMPGEDRPALLCQMQISQSGSIDSTQFEFAIVRSAHKLSYETVAAFLENDQQDAVPEDSHALLKVLLECSQALNNYRREHMLLMEERDDYDLILNDQKHIADIKRQSRNLAQQIVEESMLATNRSAGDFFASHANSGIYSSHKGFRSERLDNIRKVIAEDFPELAELDLLSLNGYRELINALHHKPEAAPQLAAFRLMLQAGVLTTEASPHLGLAMQHYTTVTSPIRRYNDFYNHRALRTILEGGDASKIAPSEEELNEMQKRIGTTRAASRDLEQWLYCLFVEEFKQKHPEQVLNATVFRVTSQGVTVKLTDWGINGFVKLDPKAFKFDPDRMTLKGEEQNFVLDQPMQVLIDRVDLDKKRINFKLA